MRRLLIAGMNARYVVDLSQMAKASERMPWILSLGPTIGLANLTLKYCNARIPGKENRLMRTTWTGTLDEAHRHCKLTRYYMPNATDKSRRCRRRGGWSPSLPAAHDLQPRQTVLRFRLHKWREFRSPWRRAIRQRRSSPLAPGQMEVRHLPASDPSEDRKLHGATLVSLLYPTSANTY